MEENRPGEGQEQIGSDGSGTRDQTVPGRHIRFHGSGASLFGIHVVNILLTILTLGIYYFWGKVKVRNYIYSQSEFEGDRFAYHGTGKELLLGWLRAILIMAVAFAILFGLFYLFGKNPAESLVLIYLLFLPFLFLGLIPIAIVGAWRYRLSRSSWRNIRFSFRGSTKDFLKLYAPGLLLTMITLGLYSPYFEIRLLKFLLDRSYFGTSSFHFDGNGRDLFPHFLVAFLLLPFTLGLSMFWYAARQHRYCWSHTRFEGAQFHSTMTGGSLLWLHLVNGFLVMITLGLGTPWVVVRTARFMFERTSLHGPLDLSSVVQAARDAEATGTGEGIADLLDMDLGIL